MIKNTFTDYIDTDTPYNLLKNNTVRDINDMDLSLDHGREQGFASLAPGELVYRFAATTPSITLSPVSQMLLDNDPLYGPTSVPLIETRES